MTRGTLKVYLGAAPGVGKTYAMLGEGQRARERGRDVVIGFVEFHGRRLTALMAEGLETVPRQTIDYRGTTLSEMDVDAVLRRRPAIAVVDELAHTNAPGSRNAKRWQDVDELLDAGINVLTTLNVQHLESLEDVVKAITGIRQQETVPDAVVRRADQIELVDMPPEALRRRLAHGNVYPPEKIDAALGNYFRAGNLTALRELALLWVADRVEEGLEQYRTAHRIEHPWPARERIVVALTGGPEGDTIIRRAARIATQKVGSELLAVYVTAADGLTGASPVALAHQRALVEELGGTFHHVVGDDIPTSLLEFARAVNATQLVLGSSRRGRWQHLIRPGVGTTVSRLAEEIDVHMVPHEKAGQGARPPHRRLLSTPRLVGGWLLGVAGPPVLTGILTLARTQIGLSTQLMLFLTLAVGAALVGGIWPGLAAALLGSMFLNFFFTPPLHTFTIQEPENILALVVFVVLAVAVASVVDLGARRTREAAIARAEADTLSTLAGSVLRGDRALPALLERARETFGMRSVALLERTDGRWRALGQVGVSPAARPEDGDAVVEVTDELVLALCGPTLPASARRVLEAFADHLGAIIERRRLEREAKQTRRLAAENRVRTALLAAVSHDLRTPIAAVKAAVGTLRQKGIRLTEPDRRELLADIEESADRLNRLVTNLLDMSRVSSGSVTMHLQEVTLDEILPAALVDVPGGSVQTRLPELPALRTDPGLLERTLANIIENAVHYSPDDQPVVVTASAVEDSVQVRVVDRGPGVPDDVKDRIFEPFQRYGDAPSGNGVGLGLAVARGFAEILGGTLEAEDTPGGGLTLVLTLPRGGPEDSPSAIAAAAAGVPPVLEHRRVASR